MLAQELSYKQFSRNAILITWKAVICEDIIQDILQFKEAIVSHKGDIIEDIIIGYNSLTLILTNCICDFYTEVEQLQELYSTSKRTNSVERYIWQIPVCYDIEFGIDLQELSKVKKLPIQRIIELHTQQVYTIYFIGFLPGFLYLGGLNEQLHTPRKANPRLRVHAGSVAVGGSQTGVYPQQSAGGWNIIGRTPVNFFDVEKAIPCFAKSGDKIKFVSISKDEFQHMKHTHSQAKKQLYNA